LLDPRDQVLRYVGKTHLRREIRLRRHIEAALAGRRAPVCEWIRELHRHGVEPHVFVIERVPRDGNWQEAERAAIRMWREWPAHRLPVSIPPQTAKSVSTEVRGVMLLNVSDGG